VAHHGGALRRLIRDDGLVDALRVDPLAAPVPARERALLRYAARLTREPASITRADLDALRAEGWDDRAILDLNHVVAYFSYVNRIADGLGVRLEP